jgi:hypothetical protein
MVQQPEILVHISAPGRIVDDARYRKEALGFLRFEAVARHVLLATTPKERDSVTKALEAQPATNVVEHLFGPVPEQTVSQTLWTKDRVVQRRRFPEADATSTTPRVLKPPLLQGTTPISLLPRPKTTKSPLVHIERTPAVERPRTAPTSSTTSQETSLLRRTQSDSWEPPPSVVPDSQPSQGILKRGITSSSPSPTHRGSSSTSKRRRLDSSPAFNAAPSAYGSPLAVILDPRVEVVAPFRSSASASTSFHQPASSPSPATSFPLELHPPRPPTGIAPFDSHLTLSLTNVSTILAVYFQPISHTRALDPLERGHWLLSTTAFSPEIKHKFWDFLTKFFDEGRAGWGVWCMREGETVKVYCWGEVVREVWCMLFLGSHRKINRVAARWIDSAGEVVVQMS